MSTRRASDNSNYHQNRYAGSAEFKSGLLANLVAKRAALLDHREDRELVWAVHLLSHESGGLETLAANLLARYSHRLGTRAMIATGKTAGEYFTAAEVAMIQSEMPGGLLNLDARDEKKDLRLRLREIELTDPDDLVGQPPSEFRRRVEENKSVVARLAEIARQESKPITPRHLPVSEFHQTCLEAARAELNLPQNQIYPLSWALADMCLKWAPDIAAIAPWYFAALPEVLREYIAKWIADHSKGSETQLGRIVAEEFDYTLHSRCLTLLEGEPRRGKSFAAKKCCMQNPGLARYVEIPPGNDETTFFRELARGLGLGNLAQYTLADVRDRVINLLLTGHFILVLDESQRLWPSGKQRLPHYPRINWIMTLANHKVPMLLMATPQFVKAQNQAEQLGWNSSQLTGRISNYKLLPSQLGNDDLIAIAREFLPEASAEILEVLAAYARTSSRYIAAIETITTRARYVAGRSGRTQCTADDVRTAMSDSVIPSDNRLKVALENARENKTRRRAPEAPLSGPAYSRLRERESKPNELAPVRAFSRHPDSDTEIASCYKRNLIEPVKV